MENICMLFFLGGDFVDKVKKRRAFEKCVFLLFTKQNKKNKGNDTNVSCLWKNFMTWIYINGINLFSAFFLSPVSRSLVRLCNLKKKRRRRKSCGM